VESVDSHRICQTLRGISQMVFHSVKTDSALRYSVCENLWEFLKFVISSSARVSDYTGHFSGIKGLCQGSEV